MSGVRSAESVLRVEYQPIFDLASGRRCAFEALVRFEAGKRRPAAGWTAAAGVAGCGDALESYVTARAFAALDVLPAGIRVSVNVSPEYACSRRLRDALSAADASRVVIELSERSPVSDYKALARRLDVLRALGATICLDDAGSETYTLSRAALIRPGIIKLDRSLTVAATEGGPLARHARGVVSYGEKIDVPVIAQGITTPDELCAIRALGVRFGQGDLLGARRELAHWRPTLRRRSRRRRVVAERHASGSSRPASRA
jgi:EAL domain-containing protein (putative c-di-GMP-specific phosphodiesterase class I)